MERAGSSMNSPSSTEAVGKSPRSEDSPNSMVLSYASNASTAALSSESDESPKRKDRFDGLDGMALSPKALGGGSEEASPRPYRKKMSKLLSKASAVAEREIKGDSSKRSTGQAEFENRSLAAIDGSSTAYSPANRGITPPQGGFTMSHTLSRLQHLQETATTDSESEHWRSAREDSDDEGYCLAEEGSDLDSAAYDYLRHSSFSAGSSEAEEGVGLVAPKAMIPYDEIINIFETEDTRAAAIPQQTVQQQICKTCSACGTAPAVWLSSTDKQVAFSTSSSTDAARVALGRFDVPSPPGTERRDGDGDKDRPKLKEGDEWSFVTWNGLWMNAKIFASALVSIGHVARQGVMILCSTPRKETFFANLGCISAAGTSVILSTRRKMPEYAFVAQQTQAAVIMLEDCTRLESFISLSRELETLRAIVVVNSCGIDNFRSTLDGSSAPVYTYTEFKAHGMAMGVASDEILCRVSRPHDCCTITYRFARGCPPKALQFSHDNLLYTARTVASAAGEVTRKDRFLCYLPLSSVLNQIFSIYIPLCSGASVYCAKSDAFQGSLGPTLRFVMPTIFFATPYVWDKLMTRLTSVEMGIGGIVGNRLGAARKGAKRYFLHLQLPERGAAKVSKGVVGPLKLWMINRMKREVGLQHCRAAFSGKARLAKGVVEYFASLYTQINEIYSPSECTGVATLNRPNCWRFGTLGKPLLGTQLKLDSRTREICVQGRHVFLGYRGETELNHKIFDGHGWFHLGDRGVLDSDNFVRLSGRRKDAIVTADGRCINPIVLEDRIKELLPEMRDIVVVGEGRPYLAVLIFPAQVLDKNGDSTGVLAKSMIQLGKALGSKSTTMDDLALDALWQLHVNNAIKQVNDETDASASRLCKWAFVSELSSTRKDKFSSRILRRELMEQEYKDAINSIYC